MAKKSPDVNSNKPVAAARKRKVGESDPKRAEQTGAKRNPLDGQKPDIRGYRAGILRTMGFKRVIFSADCDEDGNCPVCKIDYAECGCPGPTMDGHQYIEDSSGVMWAKEET
jgi:hypothetical protein